MEKMNSTSQILANVGKQQAFKHKIASVNGSNIYHLESDWIIKIIAEDNRIIQPQNIFELEEAVCDTEIYTIMIRKKINFTLELLTNVLARNGQVKTIFWEQYYEKI